jgi:hypothetical protein
MSGSSQQFRPQATPRPTAALPTAPAARAAPVRPFDPLAPQTPDQVQRPASGPNDLMQLASALTSLQPTLERAFASYSEGVRQQEGAEAEAAAQQAHVESWADAVRENPALASRSPYFRNVYEARIARTAIQRQSNAVLARYASSEVAASEDPNAIFGFLRDQYQGTLDRFQGNPVALAAATEELRNQSQQLARTHAGRSAENLVQRNRDSFDSAAGALFDQATQRGWSPDQTFEALTRLQAEGRAQGLSGRDINSILTRQTEEAIVRTGNTGLAALASRQRPDGTPGYGTTSEGRAAMRRAEDRVQSRAVQASNLAYTQMMRQRAEAERSATQAAANYIATQHAAGQDPTLPPELLRGLAAVNMGVASQAMAFARDVRAFGRQDSPEIVAQLDIGITRGQVTSDQLFAALTSRQMSLDTFSRLQRQLESTRQDTILSNGAVQGIVEEAQRLVGDPAQMGGIFRRPQEAAALGQALRESLIGWRQANPTANLGETITFLQGQVRTLVPTYSPGADLNRLRLERVQQDGLPGREGLRAPGPRDPRPQAPAPASGPQAPAAAPAPQQAQTVPPSRTYDWTRRPAFATQEELQTAFREWRQNPADPANPIARWIVDGGITDPSRFVYRQMGLIPATRPNNQQ